MFWRHLKILVIFSFILFWGAGLQADEIKASHFIQIELIPDLAKLVGRDDITVKVSGNKILEFRLSKKMTQVKVEVNGMPRDFNFMEGCLRIDIKSDEQGKKMGVSIIYTGIFDDPVPVRPVNTNNPGFGVTGSISSEGSFLLPGAGWYPELKDSLSSYRVRVAAPSGFKAITSGRCMGHETKDGKTVSEFEVGYPVQGLALSVAQYDVKEKTMGKVTAATYFLQKNRQLATSYLDAVFGYIELYSKLFGPYPFEKFAVVENFFPTGFGFPSYTLMGGSVLRLPFIIHTSLGHEIAHCWWGNGVFVDHSQGNWCEGLTAYVADYLYKEKKSVDAAREFRRQWLRNYSTLVRPERDFPLSRFQSRHDPVTKTIGYDKSAMVFHMIRKLIGEKAFWNSLRDIYQDRLFQPTSWSDLQRAFEYRGNRSLQHFMNQWVFRKGAPRFSVEVVSTKYMKKGWEVEGHIIQETPYFDFPLMIEVDTGQKTTSHTIDVFGPIT
jgi:hypothetical protein